MVVNPPSINHSEADFIVENGEIHYSLAALKNVGRGAVEHIVELRKQEELDALRPPIDGNDVMDYLGLAPGPEIGRVMRMLLEHRIEQGPYDVEEAHRLLDEWKASEQ